jgi:DNA-binding PadR family transcriptional regulator
MLHGLLAGALGEHWVVNTGQIYSTLARLERDGLISRLRTTSSDGPRSTVYKLTQDGRLELVQWFLNPISRENRLRDELHAKLILGSLSEAASPANILQVQRKQLLIELHGLIKRRRQANVQGGLPLALLVESGIMHLEADLRWLDLCESRLEDLMQVPPPIYRQRPRGRPRKQINLGHKELSNEGA